MKKFLSLVLALVMTMSLVTISAGAKDFDDNGDIDYKEAVDVISALGIVDGYSDGSFRPDGSLTRGAAAKIICNLILGPTTASALSATTAPFKDVPTTNVFAGYITYCAQQGIIGGYGDGTFRPSGTLTGNAFMKMLLGALGYDSSVEGYNGSNWQVNVIKQAVGIGLDDGNDDFVGSRTVTRQEAALYSFNMIQATMVEYDSKSVVVVGDVEINTIPTRYEATNTSTRTDGNIKDDGLMQFAERYFTDLKATGSQDDFGRPATEWRYNNRAIGTYTDVADETYTAGVKLGDIYSDLGLSETTDTTEYYINGREQSDLEVARRDDTKIGANGVLTQVWYEEDERGNVEDFIISEVHTYVAEVNAINNPNDDDRSITLSTKSAPIGSLDRQFETDDFSRDDLVTYTAAWTGSRYEIQTVEALTDYETGILTEWNGTKIVSGSIYDATNDFTVGSTTYDYSAHCAVDDEDGASSQVWNFDVDESELNVYLDQYGYAIYVSGTEGTKNYAAVIGVGDTNPYGSKTDGVTLLLADGSIVTGEADVKSGTLSKNVSSNQTVDDAIGDLVTYKYDEDDDVYELTVVDNYDFTASQIGTNATFTNGKSQLKLGSATYYVTDETVFFVCTDDGSDKAYDVYVGYDAMPSFDTAIGISGFALKTMNEYTSQLDAVYISAANLAGISSVDTYFVKEKNADIRTNSQGSFYTLPAIVDGERTTVRIDADELNAELGGVNSKTEGLYAINNVRTDKNGIITGFSIVSSGVNNVFSEVNGETGTVASVRGVLGVGGDRAHATFWAYNDDTAVYYVEKDYSDITVSSIGAIADDATDKVYATVDDDTKILQDVFVVEVDDTLTPPVAPVSGDGVSENATINLGTNKIMVTDRYNSGATVDELARRALAASNFTVGGSMAAGSEITYFVTAPNGQGYTLTTETDTAYSVTIAIGSAAWAPYVGTYNTSLWVCEDTAATLTVNLAGGSLGTGEKITASDSNFWVTGTPATAGDTSLTAIVKFQTGKAADGLTLTING